MGMSIGIADDWLHLRYATFATMRHLLADAAGYSGNRSWTRAQSRDVLVHGLLERSDVSDAIPHNLCGKLAKRIQELIPLVRAPKPKRGEVDQAELMEVFAKALERCALGATGLGWN
jgi:hypothetical protein